MLLLTCGALCWAFNLKFKVDEKTGQKVEIPTDKSNHLLIIKPNKFEMVLEPREKQIVEWRREAEGNIL